MLLALVGYESVKWQVTVDAGVQLHAVILSGYHKHSVQGLPPGTPVLKCTAEDGSRLYFYAYEVNQRRFDEMLRRVRQLTGLEVLSFQGTYAPGPDVTFRVRPATSGQYKAARRRLEKQAAIRQALDEGLKRAAADVAAGKFPQDAIALEGHHYSFFDRSATWAEAREICRSHGGDLACLESEGELEVVRALVGDHQVWIGGMRGETDTRGSGSTAALLMMPTGARTNRTTTTVPTMPWRCGRTGSGTTNPPHTASRSCVNGSIDAGPPAPRRSRGTPPLGSAFHAIVRVCHSAAS